MGYHKGYALGIRPQGRMDSQEGFINPAGALLKVM